MSEQWQDQSPFISLPRANGYPYLATDENEFLVVLFTAPRCGVVLVCTKVGEGRGPMPGEYITDIEERDFYAVPMIVEIEQTGDSRKLGPRHFQ